MKQHSLPRYNVFDRKMKVLYTGIRFDCEQFIKDNALIVTLVNEPSFAIHTRTKDEHE
jgi:hypothetical protein